MKEKICEICMYYYNGSCFANHEKTQAQTCKDFKKDKTAEAVYLLNSVFGSKIYTTKPKKIKNNQDSVK